jgi:SAC3 family protein LENG8/THP3
MAVPPQMNRLIPPNAMAPAPEPQKQKVEWPESVRNYVQRSFLPANMDSSVSRADMEAKLKETISIAKDSGALYSLNWDNMILPQEMVKQEREKDLKRLMTTVTASLPPQIFATPAPSASKKRKSSDLTDDDSSLAQPSWQNTNNTRASGSLEDRITYPTPDKRMTVDEPLPKSSKFQKQMEKRQKRFDGGYKSAYRSPSPPPATGPVVGTSTILEKKYLRLTAPPVPSQVRPEYILRQTLDLLKKKWKKESNYSYICDQFKSMRQDLTVQRIKNDFTVSVYEIHARIALEKGDLGEYNQCQTQLRSLYAMGLKGNPVEFKAYRILYFIHTANRTGLNDALADLTTAEKGECPIKHALDVRSALALGNYHRFFQLYLDTPNMGAYLMDMFVVRERLAALCNMCKAYVSPAYHQRAGSDKLCRYKPDMRLRFITEELGFESDADAAQFIIDYHGAHLLEDREGQISFLAGKAGALFESARGDAFRKVDIKGQI